MLEFQKAELFENTGVGKLSLDTVFMSHGQFRPFDLSPIHIFRMPPETGYSV
jgi:hypothetical protein